MRKWVYTIMALVMVVVTVLLFVEYNKFGAKWGKISVFTIGLFLSLLVMFLLHKIEWFNERIDSASGKFAVVLAVGFILSALMGIYFTEPVRSEKTAFQIQQEKTSYNYANSRTGIWYTNTFVHTGNSSKTSSSSSLDLDDMDGEAAAFVLIVVVAIAAVIGSAIVAHFWVVALTLMTCLMVDFAVREWDVFDKSS